MTYNNNYCLCEILFLVSAVVCIINMYSRHDISSMTEQDSRAQHN